mmetsp:Transcript_24740/g.67453  ORF Transcript_24740/g.67453 Transcript_24740/m.67453 type:complete len:119 (+) Transcript_24740:935-1291(+)
MQTPLPLMRKKEKGHPENLAHTHTQTHTQRAHGQKKSAPQAQQVLQGKYSRRVHAASACLESAAWKCLILEVSNSQELILTKFMPRYDLHHAGLGMTYHALCSTPRVNRSINSAPMAS